MEKWKTNATMDVQPRPGWFPTFPQALRRRPTHNLGELCYRFCKNFHMFLRFKCLADGNSGVYFHTDFRPGTVHVSQGRQFEIARQLGDHTGGIYGDGRGWQAWPAPEFEPLLRPDDWNDFLLKVEANRYVCYLNGIKVLDYTNPKPEAHDGYIALQLHSGGQGDMMFKDLKILDLSRR